MMLAGSSNQRAAFMPLNILIIHHRVMKSMEPRGGGGGWGDFLSILQIYRPIDSVKTGDTSLSSSFICKFYIHVTNQCKLNSETPNSNTLSMVGSQTPCLKLIPNPLRSSEASGELFPPGGNQDKIKYLSIYL